LGGEHGPFRKTGGDQRRNAGGTGDLEVRLVEARCVVDWLIRFVTIKVMK
jgi:hypothetical protein